MPSLLDIQMARQNPMMAGLLGIGGPQDGKAQHGFAGGGVPVNQSLVPQKPAAPQGGVETSAGGGGSFFDRLYAGGRDPNLTPEQNDEIRRHAMLMAGLATLADKEGGLPAIARGLAFGQQSAGAARDRSLAAVAKMEEEERRRQVAELLGDDDIAPADVDRAIALALAHGDDEAVERLTEFKKTIPGPEERHKSESVTLADGTLAVFDPNEGTFFAPNGDPLMELPAKVADKSDKLQYVTGIGPDGEPVAGVINLDRGTFTRVDGVVDPSDMKGQKMDQNTIAIAGDAASARQNLNQIERYLTPLLESGAENPLKGIRFDRKLFEQSGILVAPAVRKKLDPEVQEFLNAQEQFIIAVANRFGGVRVVASEIGLDKFFRAFGFEEGDSPGNIRNTLRDLQIKVRSLELQAGGAMSLYEDLLDDPSPAGGGGAVADIRNF